MVYSWVVPLRAGRYETLRPIASGGMATVYLGRTVGAGGLERLVAIKIMHPHTAAEPEFVAMFLDEARLAARLRHPNVVPTIDLVEDPLFLVMEFIDGPSLHLLMRRLWKAKRSLPIGIALRIFLDMLAGLHAAHELTGTNGEPLHLVHRDVSPQNVLVGGDGISRLTDFGVARAESRISVTAGNGPKGKIGYMSPEQVKSLPVDRRSDIYSAGVVLWEMLAGRRLYEADNDGALITKMLAGPPGGPRSVTADVPVSIDQACLRALERDPGQRYPTAAAFAEGVEQAAAAAQVVIASKREVGALIRELGLQVSPEELASSPQRLPPSSNSQILSAPSSSNAVRPAMSAATPIPGSVGPSRLGSLADVLEPEGPATGLSSVVSEPLRPRWPLVERCGLIVGGVAAALLVAVGLVIAVGKLGGGGDAAPSDAPSARAAAPADPPTATATATATGDRPGAPPSSATASASGAPSASQSGFTPRGSAPRVWPPKPAPIAQPRPGATDFRPKEL